MTRGTNRRFRLKQIGLVLLAMGLVLPWTTGSSADAPTSHVLLGNVRSIVGNTAADGGSEIGSIVADDQDDSIAAPDDVSQDAPDHVFNVDQSGDWATVTSDDLSFQSESEPGEFFGMVGRDPWYEYGTNPEDHPNDVNKTFLENMVAEMSEMGVRWIRFEFRAETDHPEGPGPINWDKHDWFINELLPAYDIQPLALLGSGFIGDEDESYLFKTINDKPDNLGRNRYTVAFIDHVEQVAERYGDNIGAYEILNEPNNNQILSWETNGEVKEVDPEIYGRLVIDSYETIKEFDRDGKVVAGALLHHHRDGVDRHFDWLDEVYESPQIRAYLSSNDAYPWDAISIHPYFLTVDGVIEHMNDLRELQASHDDESPVWLSEIGYQADPPAWTSFGIMDPTTTEVEQAEFLRGIYTRLPVETPFVERVFWFKYEDFGSGSYARWGLVRLRDSNFEYGTEATPWPRKPAFGIYQSLARPEMVPTHPQPRPEDEADERVRYFEPTGHELREPFLRYWEDHGGLAMFGYPTSRVFEVRGRKVQYFERARFEYWPENAGTQWEVQLGLLGRYESRDHSFEQDDPPPEDQGNVNEEDDWVYFPQTGQFLAGAFRDYWENNGGLDIFGYPISPEFEEVSPIDGQTYIVQYFERARFEWHPEHAGTEHEVLLGLLGNQVLDNPGWRR
ncbi:MAG: glycosyl hydrolase [Thermomicrobiaceae bacterium]